MRRKRIRIPLLSEETLDLSSSLYMFDEVRAGILTYIEERYRGSFVMEEGAALSGYVFVSKDALCFFIRLLLNDLFGRTLLRIGYGQRIDKVFYLSFTYDKSTQIPQAEKYRLLRYAKLSKAKLEYKENETEATMTLVFPFYSALFQAVYAPKHANPFFYALNDIELDEAEDREGVNPSGEMWNIKPKST
jgi:hypothetical protein